MPSGCEDLFPFRLEARVRRIPHRHDQFVGARLHRGRDVDRERIVTTHVLANLLAVDPHRALPVDRTEVEQQPLVVAERPVPRTIADTTVAARD